MTCAIKQVIQYNDKEEDKLVWLKKILQAKSKLLLALDNVDMQDDDEYAQLMNFISEMASEHLKFMYSTSNPDLTKFLHKENFKVKKVRRLTRSESVDLFFQKIPLGE